jgi:prepilin-type N-terminal cleavage/methylation domain-containing protein
MKKLVKDMRKRITGIISDRAGYNLIELMIVIAIISVLAVLIVPKIKRRYQQYFTYA